MPQLHKIVVFLGVFHYNQIVNAHLRFFVCNPLDHYIFKKCNNAKQGKAKNCSKLAVEFNTAYVRFLMIILKRQIRVSKSSEEAIRILKSCAYYFPKSVFEKSAFSIYCTKRHNGGYLSLTNIRGIITEDKDGTLIELAVHADLYFFLGLIIALLGIIGLIYCLVSCTNRWIPCSGMILFGFLISSRSLWIGSELLDIIEHKLIHR